MGSARGYGRFNVSLKLGEPTKISSVNYNYGGIEIVSPFIFGDLQSNAYI